MYENLAQCFSDMYLALFSASITMVGLVAVFLVYRYQTLNTYVDNRKPVLRDFLKLKAKNDPTIFLKIQDIGKKNEFNDQKYFEKFKNPLITRFVKDILQFRERRSKIMRLGIRSIITWGILAFMYLLVTWVFPICNKDVTFAVNLIVILSFTCSLIYTLSFVYIAIYKT